MYGKGRQGRQLTSLDSVSEYIRSQVPQGVRKKTGVKFDLIDERFIHKINVGKVDKEHHRLLGKKMKTIHRTPYTGHRPISTQSLKTHEQ